MLSADELRRYGRHLVLPLFGVDGQERLKRASVLIVGLGGLGSPAALYLAAAGVGRLGLIDHDVVDESNLQRQVLHGTSTVGTAKTDSARARIADLNPFVAVDTYATSLASDNAFALVSDFDLVVDGTDQFGTRYVVSDACVLAGKPNVYGAVHRFEGQVSVFSMDSGPCYRCLFPEPPPEGSVPNCAEGGVLGVLPGIIGAMQAAEAIKILAGVGEHLGGRLLVFDALTMRSRTIDVMRSSSCPACGISPQIHVDGTRLVAEEELAAHYTAGCQPTLTTLSLEIGVREVAERIARGDAITLVDVREPWEHAVARLEGATLMPLATLSAAALALPRDADIVVYCHHGVRSASAASLLRDQGFARVRSLAGGIERWSVEVDARVSRY